MTIIHKNQKTDRFKLISYSFSILNLLFLLRTIWLINQYWRDQKTVILLTGFILLMALLFIAGIRGDHLKKVVDLSSKPGSVFIIFVVFYLLKKGLKLILLSGPSQISVEIGTWFLALFLWLVGLLIINFIKKLFSPSRRQNQNKKFNKLASIILLIGFLFLLTIISGYWIYTQFIIPLPTYANFDPEYSYMLNSLTPFKDLELYRRMDHPGTFMQLIGSGIALLLSPVSMRAGSFPYQYHIIQPEGFLFLARMFVLIVNVGILILIYKQFQRPEDWSEAVAGLSIMMVYFAIHSLSLEFLTIWSPNSFNFAIGTGLIFLLFRIINNTATLDQRTLGIYFIAIGLGATFHIYMVALVAGSIATIFLIFIFEKKGLLSTLKFTIRNLFSSGIGYLVGTLVILPYYGSYFQWIKDIISHQGAYGQGDIGFGSLAKLANNFQYLWRNNLPLFLFLIFTLAICIYILISKKNPLQTTSRIWAYLIGIFFQIFILLIIISKHPGNRYLLSVASLCPLILLSIYELIKNQIIPTRIFFSAIFIGLSFFLVSNIYNSSQNHNKNNQYFIAYQNEVDDFLKEYRAKKNVELDQLNIYWTYGTYSHCYSLRHGNDFSKRRFSNEINEICPNELQYDIWNKSITGTELFGIEALLNQQGTNILIGDKRTMENNGNLDIAKVIKSKLDSLGFIVINDKE